jgi:hypothetical protein
VLTVVQANLPAGFETGGNVNFLYVWTVPPPSEYSEIVVVQVMSFFGTPVTNSFGYMGINGSCLALLPFALLRYPFVL